MTRVLRRWQMHGRGGHGATLELRSDWTLVSLEDGHPPVIVKRMTTDRTASDYCARIGAVEEPTDA